MDSASAVMATARVIAQQARNSAVVGPLRCWTVMEARTATPRVLPTWREVVARAEATPAWLAGSPLTAVLVIGGLASPNPAPRAR